MISLRDKSMSFRRAAFTAVVASGLAFANGLPALAEQPLTAQQCKEKFGKTKEGVLCAIKDLDHRAAVAETKSKEAGASIATSEKRIATAESVSAAALSDTACMQTVREIIVSGPEGKQRVIAALHGRKLSEVNACDFLRSELN